MTTNPAREGYELRHPEMVPWETFQVLMQTARSFEAEARELRSAIETHKLGNTNLSLTNLLLWSFLGAPSGSSDAPVSGFGGSQEAGT